MNGRQDLPIICKVDEGLTEEGRSHAVFPADGRFHAADRPPINRYNLWIPVVSALLIWLLGFSPIWIIIAAGVGGFLWGKLRKVEN